MDFLKNYLLLIIMGLGFIVAIVGGVMFGAPVNTAPDQVIADQNGSSMPAAVEDVQPQAGNEQEELRDVTPLRIEKMDGGVENFKVELAKTESEWQHGLMERANLPEDHGMLFVFSDSAERSFWMKNVLIPLDVIFIDNEGIVHNIMTNTIPGDTSSHRSNGPVPYVLEIGGGVSEKLGIDVGDKVVHAEIRQ